MNRTAALRVAVISVLAMFLSSTPVLAQTESSAIDVQQFKPGPSSDDLLTLHGARVSPHFGWHLGLWTNYAHRPLGVVSSSSDESLGQIVGSQWTTDLVGSVGLFDRLELAVALPFTYQQGLTSNEASSAAGGLSLRRFGLGDIRIVPKVQIVKGPFELALSVPVLVPSGGSGSFLGTAGIGAQPRIAAEYRQDVFRLLLNVGVNLRRTQRLHNLTVGNELAYGVGGEVKLAQQLFLGATVAGAMGLLERDPEELPLEALGSLRWGVTDLVSLSLGGGAGLSPGYGSPLFRVLAGLTLTPPAAPPVVDTDHDGVLDPNDRCIREAEDRDGFEDADGCPELDNDRDGVADASDRCPNEPETVNGFEDEDGCPDTRPPDPPKDSDGDGIFDPDDKCPQHVEDKDGFEDEDGCPDHDNDKDGIMDVADKCPNEAEVINGVDDEDGCPDKGASKVKLESDRISILEKIYFATNKDVILPRSYPLLKQVFSLLRAHPEIEVLRVEGHTDSVGKKQKNLDLSQRRADNVRRFLVNQGVAEERLQAVGFGDAQPVDSNRTAKGRENNRRVEFVIVKQAGIEPKPE